MPVRIEWHAHSTCSYDALNTRAALTRRLRGRLDAIAVTDHDVFDFFEPAEEQNIIPAEEVKTEYGDLIGLFLQGPVRARRAEAVIAEVRAQGGLVVLPHPYRYGGTLRLPRDLVDAVDLVEVLNGRSPVAQNLQAGALAAAAGKPGIAGSDAHFPFEVGRVSMVFDDLDAFDAAAVRQRLLAGRGRIEGRSAGPLRYFVNRAAGRVLKRVRRRA